jgi:hypothetical protein
LIGAKSVILMLSCASMLGDAAHALRHRKTDSTIHERGLCALSASLERLGHDGCAAPLSRDAIGSEHNIGVEHGEQRREVAAARGSKERIDDFTLARDVGLRNLRSDLAL